MFGRTEQQTIGVTGMTCGHCENRVEQALGKLPGVKGVRASHSEKRVEISFRKGENPGVQIIEKTIADLGFQVVQAGS
jgi:copper chaperone CopZ